MLRTTQDAEEHVRGICFKTGPPRRIGAELEWTVHRAAAPHEWLTPEELGAALGPYAPPALGGDRALLPGGGTVTVEPGGQVEISSAPADSLSDLHKAVDTDRDLLSDLLSRAGLVLGDSGLDAHRPPRRLLGTPRYRAMEHLFDARGDHGRTMMGSTAGLQVCLDAGTPGQLAVRFAAAHEIGPPLLATFATSRRHAGRDTGWASGRMAAWLGIEPGLTRPVPTGPDPAADFARYALAAPLLCLRRPNGDWTAPHGVTFADWIAGALPDPPTTDDLDYHLSTLFPPVRPRGYLEIRYLDAQPGDAWIAPTAVIAALLADDTLTDSARDLAAPAAGRWEPAARLGLADPNVRHAATALLDRACRALDATGLPPDVRDRVTGIVERRLARPGKDTP